MKRPGKKALGTIAFAVALLFAALLFHRQLLAWFTGKSISGAAGKAVAVTAGPYSLTAALDPDPPRQTGNALVLEVKDASGKPIGDAQVSVVWDMPAMGAMAEMKGNAKVTNEKNGRYRAAFDLPGGGSWTLATTIHAGQGDASQSFTMTVGTAGLGAAAPEAIDHYTCPMHPSVAEKAPGKCPICGMTLVPVTKAQKTEGVVTIDDARRQLIGVRTAPVTVGPMKRSFRAVGRVTYDESSLADVNLRVRGWITKLYVDKTGQRVARGQTLFDLYSPELYNAQQDYLIAIGGGDAGARVSGLATAARERLHLLGMSDGQVDAITKSGKPRESVAFASPASGYVVEKDVVEGASVEPGARLYRVGALTNVWVDAEVYEADLANVRVGQPAAVTLDYLPGRTYDAKVSYVYPDVDPKMRVGRVRVELANRELDLRPGMFASVALSADLGTRLQVPVGAVVYTGPRRLVFVDLGEGRFRPTEVHVGAESDGMVEVVDGLRAGDVVATSGVFLISAEARLTTKADDWNPTP